MKYIILVGDGMADWPIPSLGDKTILESAHIPNMNWLAQHGQMGLLKSIPDQCSPGSEVANMAIMGYHPETDLTGRGAIEALSAGVPFNSDQIAFRCNIITIQQGLIEDYSSGHISTPEGCDLIKMLNTKFKQPGVEFFPGIQYRHILRLDATHYSDQVICTPPHDQMGKPYKDFLVKPKTSNDSKAIKTAELLNRMIEASREYLINDPINQKRLNDGKRMATNIWPWGGGKRPAIKSFEEKWHKRGSVISAVDLIFGIGIAAGLQPIHVDGATGLMDTNYQGKVDAALNALKTQDFVYVHVEAPDEMGHAGSIDRKKQAVEDFDAKIVGPILRAQKIFKDGLCIAVLPDHPTPIQIKTHARDPIPFIIYHPNMVASDKNANRIYNEKTGKTGEFGLIPDGESFIKLFFSM